MTFPVVIGFGVGDFGLNLYWQAASLYLLYFYTDVLNVPAAIAGTIYMVALVWDAVLDPVVGLAADRTNSRFGRYRPYLLFGGIPLAASFVALFAAPAYPSNFTIPFLALTQIIFRTAYAATSVPYSALTARMTSDEKVRTNMSAARMIFATMGALVVALAMPWAAAKFASPARPNIGWIDAAICFGAAASFCFLLVAASAKRLDGAEAPQTGGLSLRQKLKASRANIPMMLLVAAIAISSLCSTIFQKGLVYHLKYAAGAPNLIGATLGGMAVMAAISIPFWAVMARRLGKRETWLVGLVPSALGAVVWYCAPDKNLACLLIGLGVMSFGTGAGILCFWAAIPDTVEFGEWKTGIRAESLAFGLVVFAQKAALGLGAGFLGILLSHLGYVAGASQSASMLHDLKTAMFAASLTSSAAVAILIWFYPISARSHGEMVSAIQSRKLLEFSV